MVTTLVLVLVIGVLQLALGLYVRNVLVDAAGDGARHGALAGATFADAEARTRDIIALTLAPGYAQSVRVDRVVRDGTPLVRVSVEAPLPVIGLIGPARALRVEGHAVQEGAP